MGSGSWTTSSFVNYSTTKGRSVDTITCAISGDYSAQDLYKSTRLDECLNPHKVLRECCDNKEHPNTIPVILALDVTGSMGDAAVEVAKNINIVMTKMYEEVKDVEFMIMGIGDLACDNAPIQISQFESDIRIAEQLDKVYFEFGGGGNSYESYTAAWYMGARHCKLDCWNRGKKGIIITLGDEQLNPYLPKRALAASTGDDLQADIETKDLYEEASQKFDIYHIDVNHRHWCLDASIPTTWKKYLDEDHFKTVPLNAVTDTIIEMILGAIDKQGGTARSSAVNYKDAGVQLNESGEIVW
jgi:hypothetical protein